MYKLIITFTLILSTMTLHAATPSYSSVKRLVQTYQNKIQTQKTLKSKLKVIQQLKTQVDNTDTNDSDQVYGYLYDIRTTIGLIEENPQTSVGCNYTKDVLLFQFGYAPKTSYKNTRAGIKDGLLLLKLLCPKLKI